MCCERFDSISERILKLKPPEEPSEGKHSDDVSSGDRRTVDDAGAKASTTSKPTDETSKPLEGGSRVVDGGAPEESEDERGDLEGGEKLRMQELEKLEAEREGIAMEMLLCTDQYAVWLDSNADDGFTSDMMNEDGDGSREEESSSTDVGSDDDRESGKLIEKEG